MQTCIVFKPYNFAISMRKFLLFYFLIATIFVPSFRVFSLNAASNDGYKVAFTKFFSNSKFSKSAATLIAVDVINDFDADDEENPSLNILKGAAVSPSPQQNIQFLAVSDCTTPQTLAYFFTNLSRIPRFSFLSLSVLRI